MVTEFGMGHVGVITLEGRLSFATIDRDLEAFNEGGYRVVLFIATREWSPPDMPSPEQLLRLERYRLPTVAALAGFVTGPPLDVAVHCDIRICDAETTLQFTMLGTRRMTTLFGTNGTVETLERRGRFDAETALRGGFVSKVSPAGEAEAEGRRLAGVIASRGPIATQFAREAIWRGLALPLEEGLRMETDLTLLLQTTKDRAEGVRAFLEKRPPQFVGN